MDSDAGADADAKVECDGGMQPIGVNGDSCCTPNELACAGHAQKLVLICDPKTRLWAALQPCSGKQLCDSQLGTNQGSCQDPIAACVGKYPGDTVCDGLKAVQCGPDLVTSIETTCSNACKNGECVGQCGNGAVSSLCSCGSSVVDSGFCCGGVARSKDCARVRLDGGLVSGTSTFFGKIFSPLLPYLTAGTAYDSIEGITGNYPIAKTDYDALYQNETWINTSIPAVFTIPVDNGNYTVHMHFVDWVFSKAGERQFRVELQGAPVLTDFDIIKEAGKSTALVKSFDVAVSNGAINLTLTNQVSNAELAAVEILPQGEAHLPTTANYAPTVNAGADQTPQWPTTDRHQWFR